MSSSTGGNATSADRPLRLLSLGKALDLSLWQTLMLCPDGGGVKGLATLIMLQELFSPLRDGQGNAPLPWQYFDLIGGTSTGGLIAIMLGRLHMSIEDAIEAYKDLSGTIFAKKWWAGNKITRLIGGEAKQYAFSGEPIKQGVQDVLQKQGLDSDVALLELEESSCRTFVSAVNAVTTHAELLRTYRLNKPGQTHYPCTVWEAARATSAAPMYFEPIEIGAKIKTTFVDGGLRDNNPVGLVTAEAHRIWPGRKIGCLVSLGTGVTQPDSLSVTKSRLHEVLTTLASMTTDAHNRHLEFRNSEEGRGLLNDKKYFRFSPTQGFGQVSMEDFEKADSMVQFARDYVREHDDAFEHCMAVLGSLSTGM
ncbi:uncharacterized protein A1O5_08730 [Cladophialophora psammophila CBS 110553]|uniref:PNPLA domain-containing protein n=1 Tax=Cladophialophora psammophila CBS 110553 TaxID=1182543 RepID=W9WSW4_9EURO|nr:uncharacterized protein A1O5_08730 [Cladophialophora psammophila CBS 110553]EXJ68115.1 hypothetical protein A1O5_08730 [Cladophialophora psammophila CBS 110553]